MICDAVVYDALANPALLALAKVQTARRKNSLMSANAAARANPLGKTTSTHCSSAWPAKGSASFDSRAAIRSCLVAAAKRREALAAAGIAFEVVPGVTAGIAAPAYAGIPVTHRGLSTSVTFVTGHEDPGKDAATVDWSALARAGGTIVLYMGVKTLPRIASALMAGGMAGDTPAAAVQWGTYPHQRTVSATVSTLDDAIRREGLEAPVITVIGPVVSLRESIAWFDSRPLFGKRIVVTRARSQAASLTGRLTAAGAHVIEMPATQIEPTDASRVVGRRDATVAVRVDRVHESERGAHFLGRVARTIARRPRACRRQDRRRRTGDLRRASRSRPCGRRRARPFRRRGAARCAARPTRCARRARAVRGGRRRARSLQLGLEELGAVVDRVELYRSVRDGDGAENGCERCSSMDKRISSRSRPRHRSTRSSKRSATTRHGARRPRRSVRSPRTKRAREASTSWSRRRSRRSADWSTRFGSISRCRKPRPSAKANGRSAAHRDSRLRVGASPGAASPDGARRAWSSIGAQDVSHDG